MKEDRRILFSATDLGFFSASQRIRMTGWFLEMPLVLFASRETLIVPHN